MRATTGTVEREARLKDRSGGFVPLEAYAVLGDGHTVALVAADGQIDWLPTPSMHAPPVFAAVLDREDGGFISVRPEQPFTAVRRYLPGTPILETTYRTADGEVRVTDALTGPLPWTELVRRIDGISGEVPMTWEVRPGTRFGTAQPWTEGALLHCGDQHLAVRAFEGGDPQVTAHGLAARFRTGPGRRTPLALTVGDDGPIPLPGLPELLGRLKAAEQR